jgi:hypothetical protein
MMSTGSFKPILWCGLLIWAASCPDRLQAQPKTLIGDDSLRRIKTLCHIYWQNLGNNPGTLIQCDQIDIDVSILNSVQNWSTLELVPLHSIAVRNTFLTELSTCQDSNDSQPKGKFERVNQKSLSFARADSISRQMIRPAEPGGRSFVSKNEDTDQKSDPKDKDRSGSIQVSAPYAWDVGLYTITLKNTDRVKDSSSRWVEMSVYSHTTKARTPIGSLMFEGRGLAVLGEIMISHLNIYRNTIDVSTDDWDSEYHAYTIALGNIRYDGKPIRPTAVVVEYNKKMEIQSVVAESADEYLRRTPGHKHLFPADTQAYVVLNIMQENVDRKNWSDIVYRDPNIKPSQIAMTLDEIGAYLVRASPKTPPKPVPVGAAPESSSPPKP